MSNGLRITYTPRSNASPEGELAALANVYSFVLQCSEERRAAGVTSTNGDDDQPEGEAKNGSKPRP
jgi:hypothetical protein